jgi:hypothetical protein
MKLKLFLHVLFYIALSYGIVSYAIVPETYFTMSFFHVLFYIVLSYGIVSHVIVPETYFTMSSLLSLPIIFYIRYVWFC